MNDLKAIDLEDIFKWSTTKLMEQGYDADQVYDLFNSQLVHIRTFGLEHQKERNFYVYANNIFMGDNDERS